MGRSHGPRPVHPRACGEQGNYITMDADKFGSSPRMRGTESLVRIEGDQARFIPAHAGNRLDALYLLAAHEVHPRACGEQTSSRLATTCTGGSSPRMRGTGTGSGAPSCEGRFIPAHAGNRQNASPHAAGTAVHPRACGEQGGCPLTRRALGGSSPRMRGTDPRPGPSPTSGRFIPAHAGNSPRH